MELSLYSWQTTGLQRAPVTTSASRADVVERARTGDVTAFRELYALHHRQVTRQLAFLVPRSDLEDVVQDVFIEVFKSIRRFEGKSAFTTWLYRLTVHVAMKARRKHTRSRLDIVEEVPDQADERPTPTSTRITISEFFM